MDFVDEIYEAAAIPERWGGAGILDKLASLGQCRDGILFSIDPSNAIKWVSNDAAKEKTEVYIRENWVAKNPYLETEERISKFNEPRFLLDTDVMSKEEMRDSFYYRNFMLPQECYWHAGTSILAPSGDIIKISVHRSFLDGPLSSSIAEHLTSFRPHLARAALVAARLRFEQVKTALQALDAVGLKAAAINNGRIVHLNESFEKLIPSVVRDTRPNITFAAPSANKCWSNLLSSRRLRLGGSFPIAANESFPAMVVHILPIVGAANDVFAVADVLIVITESTADTPVKDGVLKALYDLTPAESEIAREIALGRDVNSIATTRGVSTGTVRAQLHAIFEKTGANRQSELRLLIASLGK